MTIYSIYNANSKTLLIYSILFILITLYLGIKYLKKTKNITLFTKLTYISFLMWNVALADKFGYNFINSFLKTKNISNIFMLLTGLLFTIKLWLDLKKEIDKEKVKEKQKNIIFALFCIMMLIYITYFD